MGCHEYAESLRGVYVLVVDDSPGRRAVLREVFQYCGALVRDADGTAAAHAILREVTPSVLVLAIREPGDQAWALVRFVRSLRLEHGGKMPVIGVGPGTLAETGRLNGVDAYVMEPVDAWALCRVVADVTD
jgi:CheY-like chemotaxis protein